MDKSKRFSKFSICLLLFMMIFANCKKEPYIPEGVLYMSSVLVYMEANNNLKQEAFDSINGMEEGALNINGVLLVYVKTDNNKSYLLRIKHDSDPQKITSDTISVFTNDEFSNPSFMKKVISVAQEKYRVSSYGLILWSHGTAWAPPKQMNVPKVKAFGNDRGKEMDILELKDALPDNLEFLIFDACNMASVEVLFEFRKKAKYIVASPTETNAESLPYKKVTTFLFKGTEGLKILARTYYDHYNAFSGYKQSATVSLIETHGLDILADKMNLLVTQKKKYGEQFKTEDIQRMDFTQDFPVPTYDFENFLVRNFDPKDIFEVTKALNLCILYKANTQKFLGNPIISYSGLTCFIPSQNNVNMEYYRNFEWFKRSGMATVFSN